MDERYWLHVDTGELDKVPPAYEHMDYVYRVPHKFGLTDKDAKVLKWAGSSKLMKKLFEKHYRMGIVVPNYRAPYVYFQTAYKDDGTLKILKKHIPKEWLGYNPANTEVRWDSGLNYLAYLDLRGKALTNLKRFMESNTVNQLYQIGMPEYHKTITMYRESIRNIILRRQQGEFTFRECN